MGTNSDGDEVIIVTKVGISLLIEIDFLARPRPRPRPALPRLLLPHHRLQVRGVRRAAVRARVRGGGQLPAPRRVRHSGALRGGGRGGHHAVHHTTEVPAAADLGPRQVRTLPVELGTKVHTNVCNHVKKNPG